MTHAAFRQLQAKMDEFGMVTHIRHIQTAKVGRKVKGRKVKGRTVFSYKYRYEVIVNGEIVKQTLSRRTAKKFLAEWYQDAVRFELLYAELNELFAKLKRKGYSHATKP